MLSSVRSLSLRLGAACPTRRLSTTCSLRTHYETLGVASTATPKEVKAAYFKLSKKHHPDVNQDDPKSQDVFVKITQAYSVLSNKESREKYDRSVAPRPTPDSVVYRKHWINEEGVRPMHNQQHVYARMVKREAENKRERYVAAGIILASSLVISSLLVFLKIGMIQGWWRKGPEMLAKEKFEEEQKKYEFARVQRKNIPRT